MTPIPDHIIDRAVELWCRALKRPVFDNGDPSLGGFINLGLAGMVAERDIAKVSDYADAIERFRNALSRDIKAKRDAGEHFDRSPGVDYGPGISLAAAADEAGIPHSTFSIKSRVTFWTPDYVESHFGYAAPSNYHYPLSGGRWLICRLTGDDMPKIIAAVEAGILTEFEVEEPTNVQAV